MIPVVVAMVARVRPPSTAVAPEVAHAVAVAHAYDARLAAAAARVADVKRHLVGDRRGWERVLRRAELANDALGLPPFTQVVAPTAAWRPSPASLLGIAAAVERRAGTLGERGDVDGLRALEADATRRYREGLAAVERDLATVEAWLAKPDPIEVSR